MNAAVFGKSLMVLGRWLAAAFRFFRTALAVLGLIVIVSGAAWMLSRSDAPSGAQCLLRVIGATLMEAIHRRSLL